MLQPSNIDSNARRSNLFFFVLCSIRNHDCLVLLSSNMKAFRSFKRRAILPTKAKAMNSAPMTQTSCPDRDTQYSPGIWPGPRKKRPPV